MLLCGPSSEKGSMPETGASSLLDLTGGKTGRTLAHRGGEACPEDRSAHPGA